MAGVMSFEDFFEFMRRDLRLEEASFSGKWRIYNPIENHIQAISIFNMKKNEDTIQQYVVGKTDVLLETIMSKLGRSSSKRITIQ